MNKLICSICAICTAIITLSCANVDKQSEATIKEARQLIADDKAKCVLIQNAEIVVQYNGRGVSPLLDVYQNNKQAMKGGIIVDKLIGRAAAFIIIKGGVSRVYTPLISEDAKKLLEEYNIKVEYDKIVPKILNRQRDGLCPLENSVLGETDPDIALNKICKTINFLINTNMKTKGNLGKLNFKATKFGLGGQAAIEKWESDDLPVEIIKKAYSLGVNYFDTSNVYGESQVRFGKAFRELGLVPGIDNYDELNRKAIFLTSKTGIRWATRNAESKGVRFISDNSVGSGCVDDIKRSLTQLFGDGKGNYHKDAYIDMILLHDIGTLEEVDAVFEGLDEVNNGKRPKRVGALLALRDLRDGTNLSGFNPKNEKVIKHIGVSGHNSPAILMELLRRDEQNLLEGLLITINPNDNLYFNMQNNILPVAKAKNMGVIGMKVFANGALYSRDAQWAYTADEMITTVGTPELSSRSLIEYALSTPGIDIIITGIGKISDNNEECQLYQNFMDARESTSDFTAEQRSSLEDITKQVKGGKTNYFQAEALGLTQPQNVKIRNTNSGNIILWDNAYAGKAMISHYNIIRDGETIAKIDYKPQTTMAQYEYSDNSGKSTSKYSIETVDKDEHKSILEIN